MGMKKWCYYWDGKKLIYFGITFGSLLEVVDDFCINFPDLESGHIKVFYNERSANDFVLECRKIQLDNARKGIK